MGGNEKKKCEGDEVTRVDFIYMYSNGDSKVSGGVVVGADGPMEDVRDK